VATGSHRVEVEEPAVRLVAVSIDTESLLLDLGTSRTLSLTAHYSDGSARIPAQDVAWESSNVAAAVVSADGVVRPVGSGTTTVTGTFQGLADSVAVSVIGLLLPPDPQVVAPPLDPTGFTSPADEVDFLYEGEDPIQRGVDPDAVDPMRSALVSGRVVDQEGATLPGIRVRALEEPGLGETWTRLDGRYDLVVNGGGHVTLVFESAAHLTVHRQFAPTWGDRIVAADVAMTRRSAAVTRITLRPDTEHQVAQGSTSSDESGTRTARLLFAPGTLGAMTLPDGSTRDVGELHVRATEYTVGTDGPAAMPALLPAQSAYTYCVELSGDEADAASATRIEFSKPVRFYVDNFLGFPVGEVVPIGSYDRWSGRWIVEANGRVVRVFPARGSEADLDTDGDGAADDGATLEALGIDGDERRFLAAYFPAGVELWRATLDHFTPFDLNWALTLPVGAVAPGLSLGEIGFEWVEDGAQMCGSVIDCQNQALGEMVPVVGAPFQLVYRSDRTPGARAQSKLEIPVTGRDVPAPLKRVVVEVSVAGRKETFEVPASPNRSVEFRWDGRDAWGRRVQGTREAVVRIGYVYDVYYARAGGGSRSFGLAGRGEPLVPARTETTLWQTHRTMIGSLDARAVGMGGWTPDNLHLYDPGSQTVFLGDGTRRQGSVIGRVIETVAGNGSRGFGGDNGPATASMLAQPRDVAVAPNGEIYIADTGNQRVRRVDRNGVISTVVSGVTAVSAALSPDETLFVADFARIYRVEGGTAVPFAGGGTPADGLGDGGPALDAIFDSIRDIAFGPDGSLYVADSGFTSYRIRRILTDGTIVTVAGNGAFGNDGDGGAAIDASIGFGQAVSVTDDGALYFATNGYPDGLVRRVDIDGVIDRAGGNVTVFDAIDGVAATESAVDFLQGMTTGADGRIYVATVSPDRVRVIGADGIVRAFAGEGTRGFQGDGGAPETALLDAPIAVAVGPDRGVYVTTSGDSRIRRVGPSLPGFGMDEILVPSSDGGVVFVFDAQGRHVRTVDAIDGLVLIRFAYTSAGLGSVTDRDGRVTTIERDADGNPVAIVAPGGVRTELAVGADGYLASITNPNRERFDFVYRSGGLLESFRRPRGNAWTFSWDADGRLVRDTDPVGGYTELGVSDDGDETTVTVSKPFGRKLTVTTTTRADGSVETITTGPGGEETFEVVRPGGLTESRHPDGTRTSSLQSADDRFGQAASRVSHVELSTPSGRRVVVDVDTITVLEDSSDPFSLRESYEELYVNGQFRGGWYEWPIDAERGFYSAEGRDAIVTVDAEGRPVESWVPGIEAVRYGWNTDGLLSTIAQGSRLTTFAWTSDFNLASVTDPLGRRTSFDYDAAGRLTRQSLPDGRAVDFAYDANGNLLTLTPPGRPLHSFVYSQRDEPEGYEPPLASDGSGGTRFVWDLERRIERVVMPDETSVTFAYDAAGRLETLFHSTGFLSFGYDAAGRLTSAGDGSGSLGYEWDGFLLTGVEWRGEVSGRVGYEYDDELRLRAGTVNGGHRVDFRYDDDGLVTGVGPMTVARDARNGLVTGTSVGHVADSFTYDEFGDVAGRETTHAGAPIFSQSFDRDAAGRIVRKVETIQGVTTTFDYEYDAAARLSKVTTNGVVTAEYAYDPNGNRLGRTTPGGVENGTYDDQDRLLEYGGATYAYTPNGELRARRDAAGETAFVYDQLGNLLRTTLPDGTVIEYLVDAQNRRIGRKVNGVLTNAWIYAGQLSPVAELDGAGNVVARFESGMIFRDGRTYRVVADHLGSPRLVVDVETGAVAQRMDFDEFGVVLSDTNPGFQPFGFAGGLHDRDTGLTRFGARDYDPHVGRFVSKDPIRFSGGDSNLYSYVLADPINGIDPSGLVVEEPGFAESLIPVWGSGRQAVHDFQCGDWGWGLFNTALAVTDLALVKSLVQGAAKGAWKFGSHSWRATREWYGKTRALAKGQPVHHWAIERNSAVGKHVPDAIKNQPWNLMEMPNRQFHDSVHGWGPNAMGPAGQLWHGTPAWTKQATGAAGGRAVNGMNNECRCD
jgi:RHS repeat-associated protein